MHVEVLADASAHDPYFTTRDLETTQHRSFTRDDLALDVCPRPCVPAAAGRLLESAGVGARPE